MQDVLVRATRHANRVFDSYDVERVYKWSTVGKEDSVVSCNGSRKSLGWSKLDVVCEGEFVPGRSPVTGGVRESSGPFDKS